MNTSAVFVCCKRTSYRLLLARVRNLF